MELKVNITTIIELELNRGFVYGNGDAEEPTGEKNFVIRAEYFKSIFPKLFPDESCSALFLETYEPETDGEKLYGRARIDDAIIEEFETRYEENR